MSDEIRLLPKIILRPMPDGDFDELIGEDVYVHMEMMHDKSLWIGIYQDKAGSEKHAVVWINVKNGKLDIHVEAEE